METNNHLSSALQAQAFYRWAYNFHPSDIEKLKKDVPLFSYVWDNKILPESSVFDCTHYLVIIDNLVHRLDADALAMVYAFAWERYGTEITERFSSIQGTKQAC